MSAHATPYRNATEEVARKAERLLAKHGQTDSARLGAIYRWRWARIGFGAAGVVAGIAALFFVGLASESKPLVLALAWVVAFAGGTGAYLGAARRHRQLYARILASKGDPYEEVIRLSKGTHTDEECLAHIYSAAKLGLLSHRLPLLVGAVLMPLSLSAVFLFLTGAGSSEMSFGLSFGLFYTLHVHLYAVFAAWTYPIKQRSVYVIGVAAATGLMPFLLPAVVVGVVATLIVGFYFVPLSFWVRRENQWLIREQRRCIVGRPNL